MKRIELIEYRSQLFNRDEIPTSIIDQLQQKYSNQVEVNLKYTKKGDRWQLTSKGWVGHIPLTPDFYMILHAKVPVYNLFAMLEYAYNIKSFRFLDGLISCDSIEGFYSQLALVLAKGILARFRQGIYRTYLAKADRVGYIRGCLNLAEAIQKPWIVKLNCNYQEYTSDIEDNQILGWTMDLIVRSGVCQEQILPSVRQAYRMLQGLVRLQPFKSSDCLGRQYNRLNEDYRLLHAICRFFIENTAPTHQLHNQTMLPFLVDMNLLYERFVAEWIKVNLPNHIFLRYQEPIKIENGVMFKTDLILYDYRSGKAQYILDTKYKIPNSPANSDISQVLAYGLAKDCINAVLVYPISLNQPIDEWIGNIRVRSLTVSLNGDINLAGKAFLEDLLVSSDIKSKSMSIDKKYV